ncbi:MAG TPA: nitronate monooxygenase [Solirubrobacteraceae bacterium]|nr:nitronate monooxygenase [Solirubrobacteraceae bacterium]
MTAFTDLVGCRLPIQLAPLGGPVGSPALAAAVSEAGGLGMIANPRSAAEVERRMEGARALTPGPVGIGFLMPFVTRDAVEAAGALAEVVEFFYGDPDPELVRVARARGARVAWQTGSAAEAVAAVKAGCDFVVAQGIEAGGHIRGTQRLDDVLAETLAAIDVPVLAAGGVGTAERFVELMAGGAGGVAVGTRFVAAAESAAHPLYVDLLIAASAADTVLTETFVVDWPNAPHRVLRSAVEAAQQLDRPVAGAFGDQELHRFDPRPPTRQTRGDVAAMALYAGESVDAVTRTQPASEIVTELTATLSNRPS